MAYLEFNGNAKRSRLQGFRLRCECGFRTGAATVGFAAASESGSDHDAWRVAWFDRQRGELKSADFSIYELLWNMAERWRDETVVPHIRKVYGTCFVSVPSAPTLTEIECPECQERHLLVEPSSF